MEGGGAAAYARANNYGLDCAKQAPVAEAGIWLGTRRAKNLQKPPHLLYYVGNTRRSEQQLTPATGRQRKTCPQKNHAETPKQRSIYHAAVSVPGGANLSFEASLHSPLRSTAPKSVSALSSRTGMRTAFSRSSMATARTTCGWGALARLPRRQVADTFRKRRSGAGGSQDLELGRA